MSETPGEYLVPEEVLHKWQRQKDRQKESTNYLKSVTKFAEAFVIAGATDVDEIVDNAIALADKLVERVGEK
jgi:DNA-directed RNA polymerase subunit F